MAASRSSASWTSSGVTDGSAAGSGRELSPRQPTPVRRWRIDPPRYAVTTGSSSGEASASRSAIAATFALRDRVAATAPDVATMSASSIPPSSLSPPTAAGRPE